MIDGWKRPPDYITNNDSYQDIYLEKFRLYDNENDMIYEGDYSGLGILKKTSPFLSDHNCMQDRVETLFFELS